MRLTVVLALVLAVVTKCGYQAATADPCVSVTRAMTGLASTAHQADAELEAARDPIVRAAASRKAVRASLAEARLVVNHPDGYPAGYVRQARDAVSQPQPT